MRSQTGRTIVRVVAVLLCALGMYISNHMWAKHDAPPAPASAPASHDDNLLDKACTTIIPEADCDKAIHSQWGTLPWGQVPTAQVGLYYFTALFCWFLLIGGVSHSRDGVHLLVLAIMALGLGFSIFLVYQIKQLPQPCTLCLITHAANALMFVCMLLLWPRMPKPSAAPASGASRGGGEGLFGRPGASAPATLESEWPTSWALLVMPIIIILAFIIETPGIFVMNRPVAGNTRSLQDKIGTLETQVEAYKKAAEGKTPTAELAELNKKLQGAEALRDYYKKQFERYDNRWQHTYTAWLLTAPANIPIENARARGPADAKHTLTIYSDFQCPTCKKFEETIDTRLVPLAARYGGLKVVFKYWPISTKCNSNAKTDLHPSACDAALAAEAAYMLGGNEAFWKMNDILFVTQDTWKTKPNFDVWAKQIGLDLDAFHKAMKSDEAMQRIKADIAEGAALGKDLLSQGLITEADQEVISVDSTPAIFVDNKRLSTANHFKTWQNILMGTTPAWQPDSKNAAASRPPTVTGPVVQPAPATQPKQ